MDDLLSIGVILGKDQCPGHFCPAKIYPGEQSITDHLDHGSDLIRIHHRLVRWMTAAELKKI